MRIKMFSIPRRCCMGKHHQCWGWDMNQGQWAWVILEMAGTGCRKGETVSRTPCRNKSVLHIRGTSRGANDALEEHGSRAWESPRAVLHCSPCAIPGGLWAKIILNTSIFCSTLLFCLWTWTCLQGRLWFANCLQAIIYSQCHWAFYKFIFT